MSKYLYVKQDEAINSFISLFVYAEQQWGDWEQLENAIAEVEYTEFTPEYADWFIEFLANCVLRVWRSEKEEPNYNRVQEKDNIFTISNYDWNAFKFAKQHGADKEVITKMSVAIDGDKLNEKEIKWLRSKCKWKLSQK